MRASRPFALATLAPAMALALALVVTACGTTTSGPGAAGGSSSPAASSPPHRGHAHHHHRPPPGQVIVSETDNGRTVVLAVGQLLVVELGGRGMLTWDRPRLTEAVPGTLRQLSVSGGYPSQAPLVARYVAVRAGTVTLTSITDARCLHAMPKCAIPQRLWRLAVVVRG